MRTMFSGSAGACLFRGGAETVLFSESNAMLTSEHIAWAYRLFLDREVENPQLLDAHLQSCPNTQALRARFMLSHEFKEHAPLRRSGPSRMVLYETPFGFRIFLNLAEFTVCGGILNDCYEPYETDFICRTVKAGQVAVDIGANIGYFTLLLAHLVGPEGFVYAFEPRADFCNSVRRSVAENDFDKRCAVYGCALGDFEGVADFRMVPRQDLDPSDPTYHASCYLALHESTEDRQAHCSVEVKILDRIIAESFDQRVAFIKIDAEGAEHLIFRGAQNLLRRDKPIILSEVFGPQLQQVSQIDAAGYVQSILDLGYKCYLLEGGALTEIADVTRFFTSDAFQASPIRNMVFKPA
jgi:FkbM family methyltransferase